MRDGNYGKGISSIGAVRWTCRVYRQHKTINTQCSFQKIQKGRIGFETRSAGGVLALFNRDVII